MSNWRVGDGIGEFGPIIDIKYGTMGIVYIVPDWDWKRIFAVKTYRDILGERDKDKFLEEALWWVNLEKHTNIVFANFVETVEEKLCIFLEYIENLKHLSYYIGKVDISYALDLAIQFCDGMVYAYNKHGIIHRDIKPDNIFVTSDGVLKISDFGLATVIEKLAKRQKKKPYATLGYGVEQPYRAPEQYSARTRKRHHFPYGPVTTRSDVYSFGVTFYQLMTEELPLKVEEVFTRKPVNPCELNKKIPEQLNALLMQCLEPDPADRFGNFKEVRARLIDIYNSLSREQKIFGATYSVRGRKLPLTAVDWVSKGFSLVRLARHNEAIDCFRKAHKLNPKLAEAWFNEGACLMELGKHEEAIALFDTALELDQFSPQAWHLKVQALAALGRLKEAVCCLAKGIEKLRLYPPEPLDTVEYFIGQCNYKQALSYCNKLLEADHTDRAALIKRAVCLVSMGKNKDALESLDTALRVNTNDREYGYFRVLAEKGPALLGLGRDEEIYRCLSEDLDLELEQRRCLPFTTVGEGDPLWFVLLNDLVFCEKVLKINPTYAEAWDNKGIDLLSLRQYEQAVCCFDEALKIEPDNTSILVRKGVALEKLGKYEEAIHCFEQVLKINPGDSSASVEKARILTKLGRHQEMADFLLEFTKSYPKALIQWVENGEALSRFTPGRYEEAIELFNIVLTADVGMARAWCGKGSVLMLLQRYVDAIHCFDKFLEINPTFNDGWYRKGVCLTYLYRHDEAKDCFLNFIKLAPPEKVDLIKIAKSYIRQLEQKEEDR